MNTVLACVKLQNVEMALINKRALSYGNDCTASFCNTLCTHSAQHDPIHHTPRFWLRKGVGARDKGRSEGKDCFWMGKKRNTETLIIPPKTEFIP